MECRRPVLVRNRDGFHARSCTAIVQLARRYRSDVRIRCGEKDADARSVFQLMLLNVAAGQTVEVRASGEDAATLVDVVCGLIQSGFGEELAPP